MDPTCAFCRIAAGLASADVVHGEARVIAFLPLTLQARAHVVVAPRAHAAALWDVSPELLGETMDVCRDLSIRLRAIGATGVNLLHASGEDAQQSVAHFHVHVLARFPDDGLNTWPHLPHVVVDRGALLRKLTAQSG